MPMALLVTHVLLPGHEAAFDALVAQTVAGITALEERTWVYVSHVPGDQPRQRVFYELYADHDAFVAHEAQPHTRRFLAERQDHIESVEVQFFTDLPAVGLGAPGARPGSASA